MLHIQTQSSDTTILFAARELKRYLEKMSSAPLEIALNQTAAVGDSMLSLGLFADFSLSAEALQDPQSDDAIDIKVEQLNGRIAGSNPRSVLIAVYRFLELSGCCWLRPGKDGDVIPQKDITGLSAVLQDTASYRHRGMCIEGSVSLENMLDSVAWAPKVGLNTYMLEFMLPYLYFDKWYSHHGNPFKEPEPRSIEECYAYKAMIAREIKRRGMTYHDMGHGWTCTAVGLPAELVRPWNAFYPEIEPGVQKKMDKYLAMIDGERKIVHDSPLNTNLCYGNPEVRDIMVDNMLTYCLQHPEVDVLHLWLGDSWNTQCECELCADTTPSDFMIMICNKLDKVLARHKVKTKICFIAYVDTMWPPQNEHLENPDRFMLLYAPISRTYSEPYDDNTEGVVLQPYVRNKLPRPRHVRENIGYLKEWFKTFAGDGLCFEYHFWLDHYFDPGYYAMGKILAQDIRQLEKLGLNGIIEDQTQRAYFPTGFPMYLYGKTLWNKDAGFDALAKAYFAGAFGEDADACLCYMASLSELFDPVYLRGDKGEAVNPGMVEKLARIPALVAAFKPVIDRNLSARDTAVALSWRYLSDHSQMVIMLADALKARAGGDMQAARTYWRQLERYAYALEDQIQPALDVHDFTRSLARLFAE